MIYFVIILIFKILKKIKNVSKLLIFIIFSSIFFQLLGINIYKKIKKNIIYKYMIDSVN